MESPEMGGVAPENGNTKFINNLSSFGIKEQKIVSKLLGFGKIIDVSAYDDHIEIFYKTGKHQKVVVRKSEVRKIDPRTNEILETQTSYDIDKNPEDYIGGSYPTKQKSYKKYPTYERKTPPDLVDLTKKVEGGEIIEN